MSEIRSLSPALLWQFFDTLCSIPHPSGHEAALRQWIADWARERELDVRQDRVGNLVIRKAATAGMEHRKGVILQAHMDMVPQANADSPHDFTRDPIQPWIDGDWVRARGTTLGADNGIGLAACLAVLADDKVQHGPLEVLLTVDEESGMTGAFGLEPGLLRGEILLNTDSEQDGDVYMGCAGGVDANITLPYEAEPVPTGHQAVRLAITGLRGGHSGINIHQGRASANKLLAELLHQLGQSGDIRLAELHGGTLRNAIAREAWALLTLPAAGLARAQDLIESYRRQYAAEFAGVDDFIRLELEPAGLPPRVMSPDLQRRLVAALLACPHGVMEMSRALAGVVQSSTNLGVIKTEAEQVYVQCLIRSLSDAGRDRVAEMTAAVFRLAGADCRFDGAYPGWQPDPDSPIMRLLLDTHEALFGVQPAVKVIHAGLECGLFKAVYPEWDMVSFGPTIQGAHSPDERVHIEAVSRFWQLLVRVLRQIPESDGR
ncbi:cytosol nonspecific dipeptidase [Zobellella denitrificans]|uniref:Cytosol non-specific dipeptidase n=1 Tax=Zobellella denitrificans TaxID=347534 RepID=A0A231N2N0_9GAMM|nr:aminoacyl-histidine dipeptidase [Zobellella denitrificans]ATG74789.1 aminoacyl-histidine dipeptidase [Zobellella denitrificans]OXS16662.1 cytosol nonspecific dipeptidase [Zobellella denitrificans]